MELNCVKKKERRGAENVDDERNNHYNLREENCINGS